MAAPNPRPARAEQRTSSEQSETTTAETTADQARRMAERIRRLPHQVVASFAHTDAGERANRLTHVTTEILAGMHPVISWLERKQLLDKAELEKRRMFDVCNEAVECAQLDIPQYAGGTATRVGGEPAPGAVRTATLAAQAAAFADHLLGWASDIEAEEGRDNASMGAANAPATPRKLNETEQRILAHCRRKAHKGERIAQHVGLSNDHTRRVLARLVREGRLRKTDGGYRTV